MRWRWTAHPGRWRHEAQTAHVEEFLAVTTSGQAAEPSCFQQALRAQREGCELTGDSAGLTRATPRRRGRFPTAFWEVNAKLARPN